MPLRTVRSPKALWYFVVSCLVVFSFVCVYVVRLVGDIVVLRCCSWGPRERCGSQGSCIVVFVASVLLTCEEGVFSEKVCGR